jgi:DnaK suppressor protein
VDTTRFRRILEDKLVELWRSALREVRAGAMPSDTPGDEGDEARRILDSDERYLLGERDGRLAQACEAALVRITRGEFGLCVDCGREIEVERLELVPWTARCLEDEEAIERFSRHHSL